MTTPSIRREATDPSGTTEFPDTTYYGVNLEAPPADANDAPTVKVAYHTHDGEGGHAGQAHGHLSDEMPVPLGIVFAIYSRSPAVPAVEADPDATPPVEAADAVPAKVMYRVGCPRMYYWRRTQFGTDAAPALLNPVSFIPSVYLYTDRPFTLQRTERPSTTIWREMLIEVDESVTPHLYWGAERYFPYHDNHTLVGLRLVPQVPPAEDG